MSESSPSSTSPPKTQLPPPAKPKDLSRWEELQKLLGPRRDPPSMIEEERATEDEEHYAYRQLCQQLPGLKAQAQPEDSTPPVSEKRMRYCLVECENGAEPMLRVFSSPADMARHIRQLDGQDVYVFPVYGVPLPFTVAPERIVLLPDNSGYKIGKKIELVLTVDEELTVQENHFLGVLPLCEMAINDAGTTPERKALPPGKAGNSSDGEEEKGDPVPEG
jgi:hypothetical protein